MLVDTQHTLVPVHKSSLWILYYSKAVKINPLVPNYVAVSFYSFFVE
jgi:hypothetical protein